MWIKGTLLIIFALCIDGLQALIGLGISIIAAFPGTVGGAAAGCVGAQYIVAGKISCAVGGFVLGIIGSFPIINGALATVTVPLGMAVAFTIDICLSLTLGSGLIMALIFCGMFHPKYIWSGSIVEFLPCFDILPGWTAMVVLSIMETSKQKGGALGAAAGVALAAQSPSFKNATSALSGVKNMQSDIQSSYVQKAA